MVWPSALEGQTGVVASANDTRQVVTVRIDGARWRGRGPVQLSRDEVEPRSLRRGTIFGAIGRYMSWL